MMQLLTWTEPEPTCQSTLLLTSSLEVTVTKGFRNEWLGNCDNNNKPLEEEEDNNNNNHNSKCQEGGAPIYNPQNSQGNRAMAKVHRNQLALEYRHLMARRNATLPQQFDILNDSEVEFAHRMREMQMDGQV
jgi:hypothetical protein